VHIIVLKISYSRLYRRKTEPRGTAIAVGFIHQGLMHIWTQNKFALTCSATPFPTVYHTCKPIQLFKKHCAFASIKGVHRNHCKMYNYVSIFNIFRICLLNICTNNYAAGSCWLKKNFTAQFHHLKVGNPIFCVFHILQHLRGQVPNFGALVSPYLISYTHPLK